MKMRTLFVLWAVGLGTAVLISAGGCTRGQGYPAGTGPVPGQQVQGQPVPGQPVQNYAAPAPSGSGGVQGYGAPTASGSRAAPPSQSPSPYPSAGPGAGSAPAYQGSGSR